MQSNRSQRQPHPEAYLDDVSYQINGFVVGYPANKDKFCKHIGKVMRQAEKHGQYLRDEWQKAKEAGLTQYKDKEGKQGWFWWVARTNDWMGGESVYFDDDEHMRVQFYIEGEPKADPLSYLSNMIWVCGGQEYEGITRLDYQFVLLAIIHDAQNWQAGGELIYFNPLEKGTLSGRLCLAAGRRLYKSCEPPYRLRRDVQQIIETALLAVKADLPKEPAAPSGGKVEDTKEPAEKEQKAVPSSIHIQNSNVIYGDVNQPGNLQVGDHAQIQEQTVTEEKKNGSFKKLLKIIAAIVGFLAALFTCIGYLLGWFWSN